MCGEKRDTANLRPAITGSPPHVRGKVLFFASSFASSRITPACAGKSHHDENSDGEA